ncbi:MAG: hypothetical protein AAF191_11040, partial [Verrucomicrobiota bacterium]
INLRHTVEIERESGGFGRYLQNQNNGRYYYNYGRPTENYREKFEEIVRESLSEQFEIVSVTFQTEDVNSRAVESYGWRMTPYAYLLLQAKGPEVDQIPSVRLDLDFLDTSGYAVLPIETPVIPIDASGEGPTRPYEVLSVTQTLDERQAEDGILVLEIETTGTGLMPELTEILDLSFADFEVAGKQDQGLAVSQFDQEHPDNVITSERTWLVTLIAKENLTSLPETFSFPSVIGDVNDIAFQRFVDADLEAVDSQIYLEEQYGRANFPWVWLSIALAGVGFLGIWIMRLSKAPVSEPEESRYQLPEPVTPFSVIGLLRDIHQNNGLDPLAKEELQTSIERIERAYFSGDEDEVELEGVAKEWVDRAR